MRQAAKQFAQLVLRSRQATQRAVVRFAEGIEGARVLELGSGPLVDGRYPYSFANIFDSSCEIVMSDVDPSHGHQLVDVTHIPFKEEFDAVLCTNVLEHVWDLTKAVAGLHRALRPGGRTLVTVPMFYPLHDEPVDYWRITEHGLRRLLSDFEAVEVRHRGIRLAPFAYYVTATRK